MRTFLKVLRRVVLASVVLTGPHSAAAAAATAYTLPSSSLTRTCTKLAGTDRPTVTHASDEEGYQFILSNWHKKYYEQHEKAEDGRRLTTRAVVWPQPRPSGISPVCPPSLRCHQLLPNLATHLPAPRLATCA
ncbi:hypothetical protein E2C01_001663 [Portunus trituberculatus]|uniref:Secreted protein n=1 Tax=Portunus trituberculatus TaxID=210409 RepID=A0A5B7CJU6_PORTR|nr:hypothetical protein [Portunus trituberculatus]